ncbi:BatA domain-containing protein [Candidatus Seribacter sulfatis]|uniref:BatA domain-containing protein n=1 Tax=Candidatus Seribacter sulfatis TaxID=3381756 RepID=UPI00389B391E
MTFLQPIALLGLLLALAPIIIHLLNLLRHRTVPWAATRFLFQARKSSSRLSKLKRWLILLVRVLALAALAFMIARPMTGGDSLFSLSNGSPEVLVLVLDRSASMETTTDKDSLTKRQKALEAFQSFARPWTESRLVVLDSALEEPFFIDRADSFKDEALQRFFGPTDTAADLPGTLSKTLDWLKESGVGTAEILVVSDMQSSNWELERNADIMRKINRTLSEKKDFWKLTFLNMADPPPYNFSVTVDQVNRMPNKVEPVLNLRKKGRGKEEVRLTTRMNGKSDLLEVELVSQSVLWRPTFDLKNEPEEGWISILSPDDFCQSDNICYLTYGSTEPPQVAVRASNPRTSLILRSASQTEQGELPDPLPLSGFGEKDLLSRKILIHQGEINSKVETVLEEFVIKGGSLVLFPPEVTSSDGSKLLSWNSLEEKLEDEIFQVSNWREDSGLLTNSSDGNRLPLDRLAIKRRRTPQQGETLAYYSDGKPFLSCLTLGKGIVYFFSTLPLDSWSSMSDGYVLVPALQRLIEESSSSNSFIQSWFCGEKESKESILFEPIGDAKDKVPYLHAGIYRVNGRLTAINRPKSENDTLFLTVEQILEKLPNISPRLLEDESSSASNDRSEAWSFFLTLCLILLLGEALLGQPALAHENKAISINA